jgi:hypothetical protein
VATRVILASSAQRDYAFPVGIAALLWREVIGYEPFVFLCGSSDPDLVRAGKFLDEFGIERLYVPPLPEWPVYVTAQNIRYHASCLDRFGDDWLMLSDADMFPLNRQHFHQHEDYAGRFVFYYANGDHFFNYPTCYMTARATDWREVMGLSRGGDILGQMKCNVEDWLRPRLPGMNAKDAEHCLWMVDMHSFMHRIKSQLWHPKECKLITRAGHPPKDRLDRSAWPDRYDVTQYTDAHILRATHEPRNWERTRPIIEALLPRHIARIDKYAEEFRGA